MTFPLLKDLCLVWTPNMQSNLKPLLTWHHDDKPLIALFQKIFPTVKGFWFAPHHLISLDISSFCSCVPFWDNKPVNLKTCMQFDYSQVSQIFWLKYTMQICMWKREIIVCFVFQIAGAASRIFLSPFNNLTWHCTFWYMYACIHLR